MDVDLLVRADYLYPMSDGLPIVTDGEVAIAAGRIVYAGKRQSDGHWQARRVIAGRHRAVLPGIVNCHTHTADILFRGQTDDASGGQGLYNVAFQIEKDITPDEWHALAQLGCLDMLRAGVTTVNDMMYSPDSLARAVEESGLRAVIADTIYDVRMEALKDNDYTHYPEFGTNGLRANVAFVERWHGKAGGRITARIAPHATDTCSAELLRDARAEAHRLGVGMHIHGAQSKREATYIQEAHGCGTMEFLRDLGVLGSDVAVAHLSFATDADFDAVREMNAAYLHCPTVYARRGRYPRLEAALSRSIRTGFATDWMLNDPFEGMRYAMNAMRLRLGDPDVLPSVEALRFFTIGGAEALGMETEIGSLEAGKRADLIMVDLDRSHMLPFYGSYPSLLWYLKSSDVVTSVIDGRVVLDDGTPVFSPAPAILDDIRLRSRAWRDKLATLGSAMVV